MRVKFKASVWYAGRYYKAGRVVELDKEFIKGLSSSFYEVVGEEKSAKAKKDKMMRGAKKSK